MLDEETINKIAVLARLKLSDEERKNYQKQLSKVLDFFDTIANIPTEGVEPLVTPIEMPQHLREDAVLLEFDAEKALENAPSQAGRQFVVPPVV